MKSISFRHCLPATFTYPVSLVGTLISSIVIKASILIVVVAHSIHYIFWTEPARVIVTNTFGFARSEIEASTRILTLGSATT